MRKFKATMYAKHKWLSGCAEINALLGLLINHMIILASALLRTAFGGRSYAQIHTYKLNAFLLN